MIQISKNWGASLPRVACMALFLAASAQAQVIGGGGFGGGGGIFIPLPPPPVVRTADIQWSKNASSAYILSRYTGSFTDGSITGTSTSASGVVSSFRQFTKVLTPTGFTYNSSGMLSSGTFGESLTWTVAEDPDTEVAGGSFTLSNLRWERFASGDARVLATATGTSLVGATDVTAWNITAPNLQMSSNQINFNNMTLTTQTLNLMMQAIGANPEGLTYAAMRSAGSNMGNLRIQGIPEASTWAQMALGLLGVGVLAQRRRRHHPRHPG